MYKGISMLAALAASSLGFGMNPIQDVGNTRIHLRTDINVERKVGDSKATRSGSKGRKNSRKRRGY